METKRKFLLMLFMITLSQTEAAWTQTPLAPSWKEMWLTQKNLTKEQVALMKSRERWLTWTTTEKMSIPVETTLPHLAKVTAAPITLQASTPEIGAEFGASVLMADLNGDSQADAVVGAPFTDVNNLRNAGQVFVYFGPTYSTPSIIINDPAPEGSALFGQVLTAGDLNKDGIKDLIVSAPQSGVGSSFFAGEVFVFLGGQPFDTTVDFTLRDPSPESLAYFGISLATGDINDDGTEDLAVGADQSKVGSTSSAGEAFVFLGANPFDTTSDFTLRDPIPESSARFGNKITIGDLNGNGSKDVIITAPLSDIGSASNAGQAFVFLGGSSFDTNADFTLQDPVPATNIRFGLSVASDDINGDNFDDVLVGSFGSLTSSNIGEEVFVFLGASNFDATDDGILANPAPDPNFRFAPALAIGDVNKDNIKDVVVGIFGLVVNGFERAGQALVFHGGSPFNTTLDATLQDPNPELEAHFGGAVAIANPKGDVLVGASGSAIFSAGQRDFWGFHDQGNEVSFKLSTNGDAIEPFSIQFIAFSTTGSGFSVYRTSYPSLPIVNNRVSYTIPTDTLNGTFITPDLLEGTVSSNRTTTQFNRTGTLSFFSKRGGFSGQVFVFPKEPTGIQTKNDISHKFSLSQNYPNPFNPSTTIEYTLPLPTHVELKVYNVLGNEIQTLVNGKKAAGSYRVIFDSKGVSGGLYFYRLRVGEFVATKKMVVTK